MARNGKHHAHLRHQHQYRGAAVTEEGKRYTRCGDGGCNYRYIQKSLYADLGNKSCYKQGRERVGRAFCYCESAPHKSDKQSDYGYSADKAKLFAYNGKNKVSLWFGNEISIFNRSYYEDVLFENNELTFKPHRELIARVFEIDL